MTQVPFKTITLMMPEPLLHALDIIITNQHQLGSLISRAELIRRAVAEMLERERAKTITTGAPSSNP